MLAAILLPLVISFMILRIGLECPQQQNPVVISSFPAGVLQWIAIHVFRLENITPTFSWIVYAVTVALMFLLLNAERPSKKLFVQFYLLLLDPLIHVSLLFDDPGRMHALSSVLVFYSMQTQFRTAAAIALGLAASIDPLTGLVAGLCQAPQLLTGKNSLWFSAFVPVTHYYLRWKKESLHEFLLRTYVDPKAQTMFLASLFPRDSTPCFAVETGLVLLVMAVQNAKTASESRRRLVVVKALNCIQLLTQVHVSPVVLQAALIATLEHENFYFFITYQSFIAINQYISQYRSPLMYNLLIGSFLLYVGLIGFISDYLNIKLFRLKKIPFYILILIPISVAVFSALSRFKVLRILQESFGLAFHLITIGYVEGLWWLQKK